MEVPLLLIGLWLVLEGILLTFVDSLSAPEIVSMAVGVVVLFIASRVGHHHEAPH